MNFIGVVLIFTHPISQKPSILFQVKKEDGFCIFEGKKLKSESELESVKRIVAQNSFDIIELNFGEDNGYNLKEKHQISDRYDVLVFENTTELIQDLLANMHTVMVKEIEEDPDTVDIRGYELMPVEVLEQNHLFKLFKFSPKTKKIIGNLFTLKSTTENTTESTTESTTEDIIESTTKITTEDIIELE